MVTALGVTVAAGCAGTGDSARSSGTVGTTPGSVSAGPSDTRPVVPDCDAGTLAPPVRAKHAGATLDDVVCSADRAAATVVGAADLGGDGVALLAVVDRQWTVVGSGRADAARDTLLPAKFSVVVYETWLAKYDARLHPTTTSATTARDPAASTTTRPRTTSSSSRSSTSGSNCFELDGEHVCYDGPPTTTTAPPVTTPDGKIVTTTTGSTTPPVTSMFCKYNYADPRCIADPTTPR